MTENLRLELSTTKPLTNTDTDLNSKSSWTPDNSTIFSPAAAWTVSGDSNAVYSYSRGEGAYVTSYDGQTQLSGLIYTYNAATSGSGGPLSVANSIAADSICPKGWKIPINDVYKNLLIQYNAIDKDESGNPIWGTQSSQAHNNFLRSFPIMLQYDGVIFDGELKWVDALGMYWNSDVWDGFGAHHLIFDNSNIDTTLNRSKDHGASVRCISR